MTRRLTIDDLANNRGNCDACVLTLTHMRGHLADMNTLSDLAMSHDPTAIKNCAHTIGVTWHSKRSRNFCSLACFSTQSYKYINLGQGELLTTDDPRLMAATTVCTGSHKKRPGLYKKCQRLIPVADETPLEAAKYQCPNLSALIDVLHAPALRPQSYLRSEKF